MPIILNLTHMLNTFNTMNTTLKPFEHFKQKETRLKKALSKCDAKLNEFKSFADNVKQWTEAEHKKVERWNDWHDLRERIENRLIENYYNYQHQNFITNGFAAY